MYVLVQVGVGFFFGSHATTGSMKIKLHIYLSMVVVFLSDFLLFVSRGWILWF